MGKADIDDGPNPRAQRALRRFTENLDAEVQAALDAAKARRLAPFEAVLRECKYLLARYVARLRGRALPQKLQRKPTGLAVGVDLVAGLKAVEPHLLDACVQQLRAAIDELRPFDGKPFARKAIVVRGGAKAGKHTPAGDEEKALERLEQAGAAVVHLFRDAIASLEAESASIAKRPPAKSADISSAVLRPKEFAAELDINVDNVYGWIHSGELLATSTATKPGGKGRYRISRQDAEDFKRRRQNLPPPPPSPRRKPNRFPGIKKYY